MLSNFDYIFLLILVVIGEYSISLGICYVLHSRRVIRQEINDINDSETEANSIMSDESYFSITISNIDDCQETNSVQ